MKNRFYLHKKFNFDIIEFSISCSVSTLLVLKKKIENHIDYIIGLSAIFLRKHLQFEQKWNYGIFDKQIQISDFCVTIFTRAQTSSETNKMKWQNIRKRRRNYYAKKLTSGFIMPYVFFFLFCCIKFQNFSKYNKSGQKKKNNRKR